MGNDEEDFGPPPEEFAEDFANFDPEAYMKRRGAGRPAQADDSQPEQASQESDDFASFDPNAYLRKRYSEQGRSDLSASPYDRARNRAAEPGSQRGAARVLRSVVCHG